MRFQRWIGALIIGFLLSACDDGGGTGGTGGSTGGTGGSTSTGGTGGNTGGSGGTGGETTSGGTGGGTSTGGMGGAGGAGGGTSTGGGGTGGGSGSACQWNINDPCGAGLYCKAPGCGMGTCEPVGSVEDGTRMPMCGCDGVTYWNTTIAASHGMAVSSPGECGPAAKLTCGGFGGIVCPPGASCNYEVPDKQGCGLADAGGACWAVPKTCGGGVGFGPNTRECNAAVCKDECELIKSEVLWFVDNTCPQ